MLAGSLIRRVGGHALDDGGRNGFGDDDRQFILEINADHAVHVGNQRCGHSLAVRRHGQAGNIISLRLERGKCRANVGNFGNDDGDVNANLVA